MERECPAFRSCVEAVERACALVAAEEGSDEEAELNTFWHVVVTYPGSEAQLPHTDAGDEETYATFLLNLHSPPLSGSTAFLINGDGTPPDEVENVEPRHFEHPVLYAGDVLHYGEANRGDEPRISFMVTITDEDVDPNDE